MKLRGPFAEPAKETDGLQSSPPLLTLTTNLPIPGVLA